MRVMAKTSPNRSAAVSAVFAGVSYHIPRWLDRNVDGYPQTVNRQQTQLDRAHRPAARRDPELLLGRATSAAEGDRGSQTHRWRKGDSNLYGAFPVKWLFSVYSQFFVRSGKGRSSSRRLRSGSRSARKGSRDRNASKAWRLAA